MNELPFGLIGFSTNNRESTLPKYAKSLIEINGLFTNTNWIRSKFTEPLNSIRYVLNINKSKNYLNIQYDDNNVFSILSSIEHGVYYKSDYYNQNTQLIFDSFKILEFLKKTYYENNEHTLPLTELLPHFDLNNPENIFLTNNEPPTQEELNNGVRIYEIMISKGITEQIRYGSRHNNLRINDLYTGKFIPDVIMKNLEITNNNFKFKIERIEYNFESKKITFIPYKRDNISITFLTKVNQPVDNLLNFIKVRLDTGQAPNTKVDRHIRYILHKYFEEERLE